MFRYSIVNGIIVSIVIYLSFALLQLVLSLRKEGPIRIFSSTVRVILYAIFWMTLLFSFFFLALHIRSIKSLLEIFELICSVWVIVFVLGFFDLALKRSLKNNVLRLLLNSFYTAIALGPITYTFLHPYFPQAFSNSIFGKMLLWLTNLPMSIANMLVFLVNKVSVYYITGVMLFILIIVSFLARKKAMELFGREKRGSSVNRCYKCRKKLGNKLSEGIYVGSDLASTLASTLLASPYACKSCGTIYCVDCIVKLKKGNRICIYCKKDIGW